jgi:hypothetical protein
VELRHSKYSKRFVVLVQASSFVLKLAIDCVIGVAKCLGEEVRAYHNSIGLVLHFDAAKGTSY